MRRGINQGSRRYTVHLNKQLHQTSVLAVNMSAFVHHFMVWLPDDTWQDSCPDISESRKGYDTWT